MKPSLAPVANDVARVSLIACPSEAGSPRWSALSLSAHELDAEVARLRTRVGPSLAQHRQAPVSQSRRANCNAIRRGCSCARSDHVNVIQVGAPGKMTIPHHAGTRAALLRDAERATSGTRSKRRWGGGGGGVAGRHLELQPIQVVASLNLVHGTKPLITAEPAASQKRRNSSR